MFLEKKGVWRSQEAWGDAGRSIQKLLFFTFLAGNDWFYLSPHSKKRVDMVFLISHCRQNHFVYPNLRKFWCLCVTQYFSIEKVARTVADPWNQRYQATADLDLNTSMAPYSNELRAVEGEEEEEAILALLMGQFKHGEEDTEALVANFSADSSVPYRDYLNAASEGTYGQPDASIGDGQEIDFDGYCRGLETLITMDPRTYSLLDPCWIGKSGAT